jgi:hypothetical protein
MLSAETLGVAIAFLGYMRFRLVEAICAFLNMDSIA